MRETVVLSILACGLLACGTEPDGPSTGVSQAALHHQGDDGDDGSHNDGHHDDDCDEDLPPILVNPGDDLAAILTPENAGRTIRLGAGDYVVSQTLVVPDGATLVGRGDMLFSDGLPAGFAPGTAARLVSAAGLVGDVVRLGHGSTIRRVLVQDVPRPASIRGNLIAVFSRAPGDVIAATIDRCELINPNGSGVGASGPTGRGVAVLALNIAAGADPPPHDHATVSATLRRSIIRSPGGGSGVFAIPFAPDSTINLRMHGNVIGGGLDANGGVSRPNAVHDSSLFIESDRNLYRSDATAGPGPNGWLLNGGSSPPVPPTVFVGEPSTGNTLALDSQGDRIEGFQRAIVAFGSRRYFAAHGASSGQLADLRVRNLHMASTVADLALIGIQSDDVDYAPGDDNTLRVDFRRVTGSGPLANVYLISSGPAGPLADEGSNNHFEFVGGHRAFLRSNENISPPPPAGLFTGAP